MDFDYDEEIVGEGPCEFCGEMYPLMLLIEHQTIHLSEDFLDDDLNVVENIEPLFKESVKTEMKKEEEKKPISKIEPQKGVEGKPTESCYNKVEPKIPVGQKQIQNSDVNKKKREVDYDQSEKMKEFTSESGERILVYGSSMDYEQDLVNETNKVPNNFCNSFCEKKDEEDINCLSDNDSTESLEEFWKRARDVLKQRKR